MIENRENEWQELEQKAMQMLDNPHLLPKDETTKHFEPILHLWIAPTFTPDKHWVFYQPQLQINPPPKPIVRQIIWQKKLDFERLNNPLIGMKVGFQVEPTFEIKTFELKKDILNNISKELAGIQLLPFIQTEMNGRDGQICGVETLNLFYRTKIFWWSSYPEEWQELVIWFEKIKNFLEENFDDR